MAKVKGTKALERITAAYLVRRGLATSEQQKLAYEWFNYRIEQQKRARELPSRRSKQLDRNIVIYLYMKFCEQEGEPISQKQACREIADDYGDNPDSVIRKYAEWKNCTDDKEKENQVKSFQRKMIQSLTQMLGDDI